MVECNNEQVGKHNDYKKWKDYGKNALFSRNRMVFLKHRITTEYFLSYFVFKDTSLKIIDIGCGDGFYLEILRNLGFVNLYGIDMSEIHVERSISKGLNVTKKSLFDVEGENEYDAIVCMDVLEHVELLGNAIKILSRLLKSGGFVYANVPICNSVKSRLDRLLSKETRVSQIKKIDETHVHALTIKQLKSEAENAGLRVAQHWVIANTFPFQALLSKLRLYEWLQRRTFLGTCGDALSFVLIKP